MFLLPAQLHVFESAPCLLHESKVTSYAELADMAEVAASHLPSGRHLIALEMNSTPTAIANYIGALGAGHAVMPPGILSSWQRQWSGFVRRQAGNLPVDSTIWSCMVAPPISILTLP
jgi:hypothetical protein